jgi:hypothetical protein
MKKIYLSSVVLITVLCSALIMAADADIDQNFLTKNAFNYATVISEGKAVFQKDGTYTFGYSSEGVYWYNSGNYSIIKDKVLLKPSVCSVQKDGDAVNCGETMGEAVCVIQSRPADLYFFKYFVCTSQNNRNAVSMNVPTMPFPIQDFKTKAGTSKIFRGIPVVTMGLVKGVTTTGVKIREKPSVNAKSLEYITTMFDPGSEQQSVPEKTDVVVIARTRDKDKVQSWNNYWFLVNVGVLNEVWMYGEFVKIK